MNYFPTEYLVCFLPLFFMDFCKAFVHWFQRRQNIFCKLFKITDPVAQGVAFGTAGHVIATTKANEISPLIGAVSSLSIAVAGVMTVVIVPLLSVFY